MHKIGQSWGFSGTLLGTLLRTGLPLMKNVLKPLSKSVVILLELAAALVTDAAIHKKMFRSGKATLIISNKEMNIMKIIKSLEESDSLIKGVSQTIKNEVKEQKGGFLSMLLAILVAKKIY